MIRTILLAALLLVSVASVQAQQGVGALPEARSRTVTPADRKQAEQLLQEARELLIRGEPIDARAKLQKALRVTPDDFRIYKMLGGYYLIQVAHFRLSYNYLKRAEELFEKRFGSDKDDSLDPTQWQEHAEILHLLSEVELNLDKYEDSLTTLERYEKLYWADWVPGSKAWVLYKLGRVEDAINVAQEGLMRGAQPSRTLNILGILLSVSNRRQASLEAFSRAIRAELAMGDLGEPSTPLNNAGEVYRELFQDANAEAAWIKALSFPDGCEHILPSLNLATLYTEQLRLLQAERTLSDFQACFTQDPLRQDTEHRSLLALARGRIALHSGDIDKAVRLLSQAKDREQWYGKIGTSPLDLHFAAVTSLAVALEAKSNSLPLRATDSLVEHASNWLAAKEASLKARWLKRKARLLAIEKLKDFEDLSIRNTDTMLEYPSLGPILAGLPQRAFNRRVKRLSSEEERAMAGAFFDFYRSSIAFDEGELEEAEQLLRGAINRFRNIDRLIYSSALAQLIKLREERTSSIFGRSSKDERELRDLKSELFLLHAPRMFTSGIRLEVESKQEDNRTQTQELEDLLLGAAFKQATESSRYTLLVGSPEGMASAVLTDSKAGKVLARYRKKLEEEESLKDFANQFIELSFSHRVDPAAAAAGGGAPGLSELLR